MSSSHWRKLAFGAVILGLTAYGLTQLWGGPHPALAQHNKTDTSPVAEGDELDAALADANAEELRRRQREIIEAPWPPDPFRPRSLVGLGSEVPLDAPHDASVQDGRLTLNGIISGAAPLAMIDRRIVGIGDSLGPGVTVTAIADDAVTLETPDGQKILRLREY